MMNKHLHHILNFFQNSEKFTAQEKAALIKSIKDTDKELTISEFKLERTEKVKRTTAILLEETIEELEQKRKAVEAQNRELEVEAALERVRARTMAMHNSSELGEVAAVMFEQISSLTSPPDRFNIAIANEEDESFDIFITDQSGYQIKNKFNAKANCSPVIAECFETWKDDAAHLIQDIHGKKLDNWIHYMEDVVGIPFKMENIKKHRFLSSIFFSHGFIGMTTHSQPDETLVNLIGRFTKVFNQTYTRFLDLKKSEEQAKEAKIEASLEKVRNVALSLRKSDDMLDIAQSLYEQLLELGFTDMRNAIIDIHNDEKETFLDYDYSHDMSRSVTLMSYYDHPIITEQVRQIQSSNNAFFELVLEGQVLQDLIDLRLKNGEAEDPRLREIDQLTYNLYSFGDGAIGISNFGILNETQKATLKRFRNVFTFAYKRFEELQKAETQTREAQVEAALEKVRSRSMAMHKSGELADLSYELVKQVQALGVATWFCAFNIYDDDKKGSLEWGSNAEGTYPEYRTPREGIFLDYYNAGQRGETFLVNEIGEEECPAHYEYLCSLPGVGEQLLKMQEAGMPFPDSQIDHVAYFKYGYIIFITYTPVPEAHDIFKRFAKVFEQSYTRFLDIKQAEKLTLETARQASLDRIRAEIASMRSTEDLQQITPLVWDELKNLGIPFIRCGVFIIDEEKSLSHTYLSTPEEKSIAVLHLPLQGILLTEKVSSSWKKQEIYKEHWKKKDFNNWTKNLVDQGFIESKEKYEAGAVPESLHLHFIPFKQGMLYIGNLEPLLKKSLDLGRSLADAFSVAYDRYEDFNKLEQAKRRVENAFKELEAAKDQLVQQEKLASLGQLTAGIAHEIKNPLNFVNNFSEVSIEMIEEVKEVFSAFSNQLSEVSSQKSHSASPPEALHIGREGGREVPGVTEAGDITDSNVLKILNDIETNLCKIHEHGTRADSIVKSMLEHSRDGSGKIEPTDINGLIKEFVNLSFHGMRAGKNPINVEIDLQLDASVGDVPLVAEDFSRVILNICNNAFDAMREKLLNSESGILNSEDYKPTLTVRTLKSDKDVTIEIEDNGPGIPEAMKDKILQPFFTTKKGIEGTGLGLSISNDIIKAHGGSIEIMSTKGEGSTIRLRLPHLIKQPS